MVIFILALIFSFAFSQQLIVMRSNPDEIVLTFNNQPPLFIEIQTEKGRFLRLRDEFSLEYGVSTELGKAELPVIREFIEIPQEAEINIKFQIQNYKFQTLSYPIYPLQPPEPKCGPKPPFNYNEEFYQRDEFYPTEYAKITDIVQIRHARIAILEIYPVRYNPAKNLLEVVLEAEISLKLTGSDLAKTEEMYRKYASLPFRELLRGLVLNDESKSWPPIVNDLNLPIHYLIVCPDAWVSRIQPFIQWKKEKGYKVRVATLSQTGYSKEEIRQYLLNEYQGPNPQTFVLLVGDVESIPGWTGQGSYAPRTDLPYACYVNFPTQYFPQVYLARFSVRNTQELDSLIQKTIAYEKGLYSGEWMKKAYFIASADQHSVPESSHVICMRIARRYGMICDSLFLYYNSGTPVNTALNDGRGWVIYSGHGNVSSWSEIPYDTSNVKLLQNLNKVPFVHSYACLCGKYQEGNCFAEAWERVGFRGGIAHLAASEESYWANDYFLQVYLFRAAFDSGYTWVMGMINKAKYMYFLAYGSGSPYTRQYFEMYNLFGDPSLQIYWDEPLVLMPTFPSSIPIGYQTITVQTSTNQKCLVCLLSKHDTIHQAQYTSTGSVEFSFSASLYDTLILTISGHNLKTYQGLIIVESPDVGVSKLLVPTIVDSGSVVVPACSVANYGNTTASYWTKIRINEFYSDSIWVESHLPNTYRALSFSTCTLNLRGFNPVSCSTEYADDLNPSNDKKTDSIFVRVLDVGVTEIIQPIGQIDSTAQIIPKAKVKNFGNTSANFPVKFWIGSWSNTQAVNNLLPDSTRLVEFAPWTVGPRGNYLVKCSTALTGDRIAANNHLEDSLWIIGDTIPPSPPILISPANSETLQTQIMNLIWHKVSDAVLYQLVINPAKAEYHTADTTYSIELTPGTYIWQVRAKDGAGNWSEFSEEWTFTILIPEPPGWTQLRSIPTQIAGKYVKDGGALVATSNCLYAFRGNKSNEFYQYLPLADSWIRKESIPFTYKPGTTTLNKKRVGKGASLAYDPRRNKIYATKGNGTNEIWQYDITNNYWELLTYAPSKKGLKAGTSIDMKIESGGATGDFLYLLAGGQKLTDTCMFRYNLHFKFWQNLSNQTNLKKPYKDGSAICIDDTILYVIQGGDKPNHFRRYLISGASFILIAENETLTTYDSVWNKTQWQVKKVYVKDGADIVNANGVLYLIKGGNTNTFYKYTPETGWQQLVSDTISRANGFGVKTGANLAYLDGKVYLLKGNNTSEFWQYLPDTPTVSMLSSVNHNNAIISSIYNVNSKKINITQVQPRKVYTVDGRLVRDPAALKGGLFFVIDSTYKIQKRIIIR
ncbi:MAG: C25 family cysteine peptidase [candidate division WOR-3 bacterium]